MKSCEICGSEKMKYLFTKDGANYQKFRVCGLIRIYPQPTDAELVVIYNNPLYAVWGGDIETMKSATFMNILSKLPIDFKITPPPPQFLDIGAATGIMMKCASKKGYQVYGVEVAKDGAEAIAKCFGEDSVFSGYFDENFSKWDEHSFDIISLMDVLEHLRNPDGVLNKIHQLLKVSGYVLITTPDSSSFSRFAMGKHWNHISSEHLFIFSRHNVKKLLRKCGFEVIKIMALPKYFNANYLMSMFPVGGSSFNNACIRLLRLIPKKFRYKNIPLFSGQIFVLAKKPASIK
jgi:2-polyprenyl-3-methyl-5-hydroxy-6-metoxy-1,4-benzoquinol methylase